MPSKRFVFNRADFQAWISNAMWFTAPVILIYLTSIIGQLERPNSVINLSVFVPNHTTQVAMLLWLLNRGVDYFRRLVAGKK